jgi:uncharacterized protein
VNRDAPHHLASRRWLDAALSGDEAIGFAWVVLLAFLRLATRPGLFPHPLPVEQAMVVLEAWLGRPMAILLEPTARHLSLLNGLLTPLATAGNLVSDAHLAALAIEYGGEVVSFDADFARFPGLRWHPPQGV